jgi:hypothetical protein
VSVGRKIFWFITWSNDGIFLDTVMIFRIPYMQKICLVTRESEYNLVKEVG